MVQPESFGEDYPLRYVRDASFLRRFLAMLVDGSILFLPLGILYMFIFAEEIGAAIENVGTLEIDLFSQKAMLFATVVMTSTLLYFSLFEASRWKATPGKLTLGIYVADSNLLRAKPSQSIIRNVFRLLWTLPSIGPFFLFADVILVAAIKRRLGDFVAKTRVASVGQLIPMVRPVGSTENVIHLRPRFCPSCGATLPLQGRYCLSCGEEVIRPPQKIPLPQTAKKE